MSTEKEARIDVRIQRPGAVDHIDLGPLISDLTVEPWELTRDYSDRGRVDGEFEISIERTHEWEYALVLLLLGGEVFVRSTLKALGDRFGNWIADQVSNAPGSPQEIKIMTENGTSITIPADEIEDSGGEISVVLEDARDNQEKVIIEM